LLPTKAQEKLMPTTPLAAPLPATPSRPCPAPALPTDLPPLLPYLAQVPDPRDPRGVRHPWTAVLLLVCCALLCGARRLSAIADWGRDHSPALTRALGFTRPKTPCCATLHTLLAALDWEAFAAQLRTWIQAVDLALGTQEPTAWEAALAVDGKTLRGALKLGAEVTALVSALSHRLGLTFGVAEVPDGDEIGAVETLLSQLVLAGKVVTLDALHTQDDTARLILERGGQYVMTVKGNQPHLQAAVQGLFRPEHAADQDRKWVQEAARGHGRVESRFLVAVSVPPGTLPFPGVAQAFVVERQVWKPKQKQRHREVVYGITSLPREAAGAADLAALVRGHWGVENRSHWVRDVTFGEDACQVRTGKLAQTLALCRVLVLSCLRLAGVQNVARETRRLAAQPWDCLRLLGARADN